MKLQAVLFTGWVWLCTISAGAWQGGSSERVMVFAPHPDDEMLVCAGVMRKAVVQGDEVMAVLMTCGDAHVRAKEALESKYPGEVYDRDGDGDFDMLDFGILRRNESLGALSQLGLDPSNIVFLGYPDTGIDDLWNGSSYTSPFTLQSRVPAAYDFAYRVGARYTRDSCLSDVKNLIKAFNPTLIYSPRASDRHQDHWALGKFVSQALMEVYSTSRWKAHLGYLVHWEPNEPDWPHARLDWDPPQGHAPPSLRVKLAEFGWTPAQKREFIGLYKSQVALSGSYLLDFAKASEIFWLENVGPAGRAGQILRGR